MEYLLTALLVLCFVMLFVIVMQRVSVIKCKYRFELIRQLSYIALQNASVFEESQAKEVNWCLNTIISYIKDTLRDRGGKDEKD